MYEMPVNLVFFVITYLSVGVYSNENIGSPELFDNEGCIVGGQELPLGYSPWLVSLNRYGDHICGGSLAALEDKPSQVEFVITAAHCLYDPESGWESANIFTVRAGAHTLSKIESGEQRVGVRYYRAHQAYNFFSTMNDIAILLLSHPLNVSGTIQTLRLVASTDAFFTPETYEVSGWGKIRERGPYPGIRLTTWVSPIDIHECAKMYRVDNLFVSETGEMLCANYKGRDACTGDSGGPLVQDMIIGSKKHPSGTGYVLIFESKHVGIVSWGVGCGRKKFPGVYVRVKHYHEWIKKTLRWLKIVKAVLDRGEGLLPLE